MEEQWRAKNSYKTEIIVGDGWSRKESGRAPWALNTVEYGVLSGYFLWQMLDVFVNVQSDERR